MEKREYFIEIMKGGRPAKGKPPVTKKGRIKILPTSVSHIHKVFGGYGWFVSQLVPARYEKNVSLGRS